MTLQIEMEKEITSTEQRAAGPPDTITKPVTFYLRNFQLEKNVSQLHFPMLQNRWHSFGDEW